MVRAREQLSIHALHAAQNEGSHIVLMKGAPERIVERCSTIYINGSDLPLSSDWLNKFHAACDTLGGLGERVLGFCDRHESFPRNHVFDADAGNFPTSGLRFVGLISLIDPPRPNVPAAVERCRMAGIRVVMVTGDAPTTAKAIARIIGLISQDSLTLDEMQQTPAADFTGSAQRSDTTVSSHRPWESWSFKLNLCQHGVPDTVLHESPWSRSD